MGSSQSRMVGPYLAFKLYPGVESGLMDRPPPFSPSFNDRKERVLKFEKDRFVEVDSRSTGLDFKKLFGY